MKAVGRAGAGVNNIPIDKLAAMGIPVFNAPGANANAVKELVLAGMLMSCRNLSNAWSYTRELQGDDAELAKLVEAGKKEIFGLRIAWPYGGGWLVLGRSDAWLQICALN